MRTSRILFFAFALGNSLISKAQQVTVSGTGATSAVSLVGTRTVVNITAGSAITVSRRSSADTLKNIFYTVVGGGGGGGRNATYGGGGGGGVAIGHTAGTNFVGNPSSISIGSGGATGLNGAAGNSSSITLGTTITATGGGGGIGNVNQTTGSSGTPTGTTGAGANSGGTNSAKAGSNDGGGGGGGSGVNASGANGVAVNPSTGTGGAGGAGRTITNLLAVSGTITYGGGGGGGGTSSGGVGGSGGGGAGSVTSATAGSANTGGGGGGGVTSSGGGGSGIVVLSFDAWDIYDDVQASNKWIYANGTGLGTGSRTAGLPIKIFPNGANTISVTSAFINDVNADVYIEGAALNIGAGGSIVCRNLYVNNGGAITTSSTGSLTVNNTFFAGATQTLPSATYNNIYCTLATGTVTLGANTTVTGTLELTNAAAILDLNGKSLIVSKFGTGTGKLKGSSTSRMYITGSAAGTFYMDQTTPLTSNRLKYLGLASNATATIGNALVIYADTAYSGILELKSSSALTTGTPALLTLAYNSTLDLQGIIGGLGLGTITGSINFEDCFTSGFRAYRQAGHVLSTDLSVSQLTDDFDLYAMNPTSLSNPDGFQIANGSSTVNSLFLYKEDVSSGSKWVPYVVTGNSQTLPVGRGFMFFMRPAGSGASGNYNAQIFDYSGTPNNGNVSASLTYSGSSISSTNGYNLLANPYSAYLNLNDFFASASNAHLTATVYKYDKSAKNYTTFAPQGASSGRTKKWRKSGSSTDLDYHLDPGDVFWVKMNTTTPLTASFTTSMTGVSREIVDKIDKTNKMEIDSTAYTILDVNFKVSTDSFFSDGVTITCSAFGGDLRTNTRQGDVYDMVAGCKNLSVTVPSGELLSFKSINNSNDWLLPLQINSCATTKGVLTFDINYNKPGLETEFWLIDKFTNKNTPISSGLSYEFDITESNPSSQGSDRFYINSKNSKVNLDEIKNSNIINVFPNPVADNEVIQFIIPNSQLGEVKLFNMLGQTVFQNTVNSNLGIVKIDLQPLHLAKGIYVLHFSQGAKNYRSTLKIQ